MTCALTTAGRIRDSILRDLKETKRHVIISHLSNVIIHFTQCFDKCMILLLSSLSVKFRISKYTTLAVFRRLFLYWIFFLDYAKKKKKEKKKDSKSMLNLCSWEKITWRDFLHTYTHSSVNLKRDVVSSRQRKWSKIDRKAY